MGYEQCTRSLVYVHMAHSELATMQTEATAPQESRDRTITVRLTASEEDDVILVTSFDRSSKSDVLRDFTIGEIRERAALIRAGRAVSRATAA